MLDKRYRWSAVLPVYNEAAYLPAMLASLIAQETRFKLVLVDNGSTDGCIEAARDQLSASVVAHEILSEPKPGQVHALTAGLAKVETEYVAICDADTHYPPHYLTVATRLFDEGGGGRVMLGAWLRPKTGGRLRHAAARIHRLAAARLLAKQNHAGGPGQAFRTQALRRAGGYDAARWPFVLKDHELAHRMLKLGSQAYSADLWYTPSSRRADRSGVRWTLAERVLYHATPFAAKDWFFYTFLAGRLHHRGQRDTVLRDRGWEADDAGR